MKNLKVFKKLLKATLIINCIAGCNQNNEDNDNSKPEPNPVSLPTPPKDPKQKNLNPPVHDKDDNSIKQKPANCDPKYDFDQGNWKQCGKGAGGSVYISQDGKIACKVMEVRKEQKCLSEIKVSQKIDSPFVIKYQEYYQKDGKLYIFMENLPNGAPEKFIIPHLKRHNIETLLDSTKNNFEDYILYFTEEAKKNWGEEKGAEVITELRKLQREFITPVLEKFRKGKTTFDQAFLAGLRESGKYFKQQKELMKKLGIEGVDDWSSKTYEFADKVDSWFLKTYKLNCYQNTTYNELLVEQAKVQQKINSNPSPASKQMLIWYYQLIEGIRAMHEQKIMHGDLRSNNICLDVNNDIKIIDFDNAKENPPQYEYNENPNCCIYSRKNTKWGCGDCGGIVCILYELIFHKRITRNKDLIDHGELTAKQKEATDAGDDDLSSLLDVLDKHYFKRIPCDINDLMNTDAYNRGKALADARK